MKVLISLSTDYSIKDHEHRKYVSEECEKYINRSIRSLRVMFPMSGWLNKTRYTKSLTSEFDQFDQCLVFSTAYLDGSVQEAQEGLRNKSNPNFSVHDDRALDSLIAHEFGHAINGWIIQSLQLGRHADDADPYLTDWQNTKRALEKELGYQSEYARKNNSEWFAERFAFEFLGKGVPKHLIRAIMKYNSEPWWK